MNEIEKKISELEHKQYRELATVIYKNPYLIPREIAERLKETTKATQERIRALYKRHGFSLDYKKIPRELGGHFRAYVITGLGGGSSCIDEIPDRVYSEDALKKAIDMQISVEINETLEVLHSLNEHLTLAEIANAAGMSKAKMKGRMSSLSSNMPCAIMSKINDGNEVRMMLVDFDFTKKKERKRKTNMQAKQNKSAPTGVFTLSDAIDRQKWINNIFQSSMEMV